MGIAVIPVPVTAETDRKKASIQEIDVFITLPGIINKRAPRKIRKKKLPNTTKKEYRETIRRILRIADLLSA